MTEPSELVERVARAIYAADWPEPYHNSFDECPPDMRARYINLAGAALSAMPDPLAMAKAMQAKAVEAADAWVAVDYDESANVMAANIRDDIAAIDPATLEVNHATDR